MLSLRSFHLFFILIVMLGADFFGVWAVNDYVHQHQPAILLLGVLSLVGGLGLLLYGLWFMRKMDRAHIQ